jgi:hypothetical protein
MSAAHFTWTVQLFALALFDDQCAKTANGTARTL